MEEIRDRVVNYFKNRQRSWEEYKEGHKKILSVFESVYQKLPIAMWWQINAIYHKRTLKDNIKMEKEFILLAEKYILNCNNILESVYKNDYKLAYNEVEENEKLIEGAILRNDNVPFSYIRKIAQLREDLDFLSSSP